MSIQNPSIAVRIPSRPPTPFGVYSGLHTHTYPNGFRVVYEKPFSPVPNTAIYAFCDLGSIYEHDGIRGGSHFIEHMCFKGTHKIKTSKEIYMKYAKVGAYFNASTEKRCTYYITKTQDEYTEHCINIVSDMMLNSTFPKTEMEKEENVVIDENLKDSDNPENEVGIYMDKLLYGSNSYGYPVDTLEYHKKRRFDYDEIMDLYKTFYKPSRMVLSIVSNLSFKRILQILKHTHFTRSHNDCIHRLDKYPIIYKPIVQTEICYHLQKHTGANTTIVLFAFRTCPQNSKDRYPLNLLENIIGDSLNSRLVTILREDNGLTYSSYAYTSYFEQGGEFQIYALVDKNKVIKNGKMLGVIPLLINMINDLYTNGVTADEVKLAKISIKSNKILHMAQNSTQAIHNGKELLYTNNIIPYSQMYDTYYKNIEKSDVDRVIQTYFVKSGMNLCLLGDNLPSLNSVKRECEKMRK